LSQADALAEQGQALVAKAARLRADTVRDYVKSEGLTVREAGALLGMSPQRVQQLVKG
jgi:DNA-directed RNA polymerase specialized sigma subunit